MPKPHRFCKNRNPHFQEAGLLWTLPADPQQSLTLLCPEKSPVQDRAKEGSAGAGGRRRGCAEASVLAPFNAARNSFALRQADLLLFSATFMKEDEAGVNYSWQVEMLKFTRTGKPRGSHSKEPERRQGRQGPDKQCS